MEQERYECDETKDEKDPDEGHEDAEAREHPVELTRRLPDQHS